MGCEAGGSGACLKFAKVGHVSCMTSDRRLGL